MAKLRIEQLESATRKKLSPIYLVTGDEPLLVLEACETIRKNAQKQGYNERELHHVEGSFNWENVLQSANSLSLFSDKKILDIRIPSGKLNDAGSKAIVEYCTKPSDDNLLLLVLPKIDKRSQSSKWYKTIESAGDIITIWPITPAHMPRWIEQRLQTANIQASSEAIDLLATKTEGNLLAAAQEIEKLKLLGTDTLLDKNTMAAAVMSSARYDIFGLIDKALIGDSRSAVTALNGLKAEGSEPTLILWALSKEIRTLLSLKEELDAGKNFDLAAKQNGIWDSRKHIMKTASHRLKTPQLLFMHKKASATDRTIKGLDQGDVWSQLLDLTLSLTGVEAFNRNTQRAALTTY